MEEPAPSSRRRSIVRTLIVAGVGALTLTTMSTMLAGLNERQESIASGVRESALWAAFQASREAERFLRSLTEATLDPTAEALDEVRTRYDILYSRSAVLAETRYSDHFTRQNGLDERVLETRMAMEAIAPRIDSLADDAALAAALPELRRTAADVVAQADALALRTNSASAEVRTAARERMKKNYWRIALSVMALVAVLVLFVLLLLVQLFQLSRAGDQLSELNARNEKAKEEAEAGNRAKSAFLASMSHEIRTPLSAIIGMAEVMAQTRLEDNQVQQLSLIRRSGDHLLDVINDILDFSKLESGSVEVSLTRFNLSDVIDSVRDLLGSRAVERGLELHFDIPDISIRSDPARLRQILINLAGNAIKFTLAGSVRVSVREHAGGQLHVEVQDTGVGISPESITRLFQEFSQVDASHNRRFGGTGLGLAISKRLVEALGGRIDLESELGVGTRFWFDIPAGPIGVSVARDPDSAARPTETDRFSGCALVVDDNPINLQVASSLLQRCGLETDVAHDGVEALRLVEVRPFDVIFMDMQMPVLDGLETTRRLRARGYARPIIGLTANAFTSDRDACLEAGMDSFMSKPVTLSKLATELAPWLEKRQDPAPGATSAPDEANSSYRNALIKEIGPEVYRGLVADFAADGQRLLARARADQDGETRDRDLHTLKGTALTLGLQEIATLAETARRAGPDVEAALNRLAALLPALLEEAPGPADARSSAQHRKAG